VFQIAILDTSECIGHRTIEERTKCEAAILDVNLNGERTLPVAEELRARKLPIRDRVWRSRP
jgi:hypothetical protein